MGYQEVTVDHKSPVSKGYGSLKKGNVFRTGLCRRLTREAGKTLYVVTDGKKTVGLRAPIFVLKEVHERDRATKDARSAAVARRDNATSNEFEAVLMSRFPKIPPESVGTILKHTLKKSSGRVGRTGKLSLEHKVLLAVRAHIRHSHTNYDSLLRKANMNRDEARKAVGQDIDRIVRLWQGKSSLAVSKSRPERKREDTKDSRPIYVSSEDDKQPEPPISKTKLSKQREAEAKNQRKLKQETQRIMEEAQNNLTQEVERKPKREARRKQPPKPTALKPNSTVPKGQDTKPAIRSTGRSTRLQPGGAQRCEVLTDFFNDEDEPILISSDDSDQSEQEDIYEIENELWELDEDSDDFVVSDMVGDSEDDYVPW